VPAASEQATIMDELLAIGWCQIISQKEKKKRRPIAMLI
jgi:hypothetical protein